MQTGDAANTAPVPQESVKDRMMAVAEGLVGCVPGVGPLLQVMFGQMVTRPFTDRLVSFLADTDKRLRQLEQNGSVNYRELAENEAFLSTVLHASQVASRTHDAAKREVLRNAVLNTALRTPPDEDIRMMFMRYLDELTAWHVVVLKFMQDPRAACVGARIAVPTMVWSLYGALQAVYPVLRGRDELLELVVRDLANRKLTDVEERNLRLNVTPDGAMGRRTTHLGDEFLAFAEEPPQLSTPT